MRFDSGDTLGLGLELGLAPTLALTLTLTCRAAGRRAPATYYSLLTTYDLRLTTYYLLPTTYYLLLTTYSWPSRPGSQRKQRELRERKKVSSR